MYNSLSSGMSKFKIYYDAYQEAKWFQELNPAFKNAGLQSINSVQEPNVLRLLRYDKPDIILTSDDKPILALEKTTEVPTGHNVGQRFARIVCSAEEKVPFIYFFPFVAMKHGTYASACWVNARLLKAMENMHAIHHVPILAIDWQADSGYELIRDGSQDLFLREVLDDMLKNNFSDKTPILQKAYDYMDKKFKEALTRHHQYADLPGTAKIISTPDYLKSVESRIKDKKIPEEVKNRDKSLIYVIGMTYVRSDPYTGTQILYDYLIARKGVLPKDREVNIILEMPYINNALWEKAAKNPDRKDVKLYKRFADIIVLADDIVIP